MEVAQAWLRLAVPAQWAWEPVALLQVAVLVALPPQLAEPGQVCQAQLLEEQAQPQEASPMEV